MRWMIALALACIPQAAISQEAPLEVYVTADSPTGWAPTVQQHESLLRTHESYFAAIDAGDPAAAYALLGPEMRSRSMLSTFFDQSNRARTAAGAVRERRVLRVTWSKDPPGAPAPGIYAVVDVTAKHARIDRACGMLVWHQRSEGAAFRLLRIDMKQIDNATADDFATRQGQATLDAAWARISASCTTPAGPR